MLQKVTCSLLVVLWIPATLRAGEWPGWRGPHSDGISDESNIPLHWSKTENIQWKVSIPGKGHSSPVIWGDRIFLTTCLENEGNRLLLSLDRRTGKMLWQREVVKAQLEKLHKFNSHASSTPVTDGGHVWIPFLDDPNVIVACYDFEGKLVWKTSPGIFASKHGFCSSPVLYKDMVIVNCDHDGDGYIVALDKATGKQRYRIDRPNNTRSYTPPLIVEAAGKMQMVLTGSKCTASYDPDTGKLIWIIDGPTEQFVASMVYLHDILFLTSGFPEYHVLAIKPDGTGNVTKTHILWRATRGAGYVPSPIGYDKYFFNVKDDGMASCWDAKTGKVLWQERLAQKHYASPVEAGGYLYFPAINGTTYVLKAGPKFEVVSRNPLDEEINASPAISHGQMFIRTAQHLYCIGRQERARSGE